MDRVPSDKFPGPSASYDDWQARIESQLGLEKDPIKALGNRAEGIELAALYSARHPEALATHSNPEPSVPGWVTIQAHRDIDDLEDLNRALKSDLRNGVRGFRLTLGRIGEYELALGGAPEGWQAWILDPGPSSLSSAAVMVTWLGRSSVDMSQRVILLGSDPVGSFGSRGHLPASLEDLEREQALLIRQSQKALPQGRALMISTESHREAGAEIDQELGIGLATAAHYLRAMERQGLSPEIVADELAFTTSTGQQIFLEIAKLRALRDLWGRMLWVCGCKSTSRPTWIHATVLKRCLLRHEPWNNLLRITAASWAAVIGGANSLETPSFDRSQPEGHSKRGIRLGRNAQHILDLESHLGRVLDPAAGSYALEGLTGALVKAGWQRFQEIERLGGIVACLRSGWLQEQIADRWQERRRRIEDLDLSPTGFKADADIESPTPQRRAVAVVPQSSVPTPEDTWWEWCLDQAAQDLSVEMMDQALYSEASSQRIEPLPRHIDDEPFESEDIPK